MNSDTIQPFKNTALFWRFLRIGAFTVGGGYAMVPLIQHEIVTATAWMEEDTFQGHLLIAQSAPGPIAVNTAVLVGYALGKIPGVIAAVLGTIVAPFAMIVLIAAFFMDYVEHPIVASGLAGVRTVVVALMSIAAWRILRRRHDGITIGTAIILLLLLLIAGINPFLIVLGAIVVGAIIGSIRGGTR